MDEACSALVRWSTFMLGLSNCLSLSCGGAYVCFSGLSVQPPRQHTPDCQMLRLFQQAAQGRTDSKGTSQKMN